MNLCKFYPLLLCACLLSHVLFAQDPPYRHELIFSEGLLSVDQIDGIVGYNNGPAAAYMSFPNTITGAFFAGYHFWFIDGFSVGCSFGIDNQYGDLSYGNQTGGTFGNLAGTTTATGNYTRTAYTGAIDLHITYRRTERVEIYGDVGVGFTEVSIEYNFNKGITDPDFFYGTPTSLVPASHYTASGGHPNFQVTALGVRSPGRSSAFVELGAGYKGIFSAGLSFKFGSIAKKNGSMTE